MKARSRSELIASFPYGHALTAAGDPAAQYADVSQEERDKSKTLNGEGSYPINKCTGDGPSVESAIHAVGRGSGSHAEIRKHIIASAKDLGCSDLIPDNWNQDGTLDESKTSAQLAAPPPPEQAPSEKAPPEKPEPKADSGDVDTDVTGGIDAAKKAVAQVIGRQSEDPDKDANDTVVSKALAKAADALNEAAVAQEKDVKEEPPAPEKKAPPVPEKEPPEAQTAAGASEVKCANCAHMASSHGDTEAGSNTGACAMSGCECKKMQPVAQTAAGATPPDQNAPPDVDPSEAAGPAFSGVLAIEAEPTGDGRKIEPQALGWRNPPLPLMLLKTETHDPTGMDMNAPAVIAGRIMEVTREPGEGGTQLLKYSGFFLATEEGAEAAELAEQMGRVGVSADIAVQDREIEITATDDMGFPMDGEETITEGTIMGATMCPFPAFEGCYIVLGDGTGAEPPAQAAEPAKEGLPAAGMLVHWMTYEECEACDEGIEVIVASGAGPVRPPGAWFSDPKFAVGDGRLVEILGRDGRREDKYACPITVTDQGQVYGHIAPWGVCHKGIGASCVLAPHSGVDYAHFKRGQHILTAEGQQVRVGVLTADVGHAPLGMSPTASMSHYDDTALQVADVTVGEDDYGIWVAGAVRPDASEEQIRKLRASSISGDWRNIGGQLELVAALAVNEPGFPLAQVASGRLTALVAAGAPTMHGLKQYAESLDKSAHGQDAFGRALGRLLRRDARERLAQLEPPEPRLVTTEIRLSAAEQVQAIVEALG